MISPTVFEKLANAWFQQQLQVISGQTGAPGDVMNLAQRAPSTGKYETYAWLDDVPIVREWLGEKKARELADHSYQILNREWEASINVRRTDLRDDKVGAYEMRVRDLPVRMAQHHRKMISDLYINGLTGLAFDGVAFFSNVSGVRTFDNLLGGSGLDTVAHFLTDFDAVKQAMAAFADSEGEPMGIVPDVVVVPTAGWRIATTALGSPADASGSNAGAINPFQSMRVQVIEDPRLTDTNNWYAFCTKGLLKPFIFQEREAVRAQLDDTLVKRRNVYQYSAEWDGNAGYGLPQLGVYMVNT